MENKRKGIHSQEKKLDEQQKNSKNWSTQRLKELEQRRKREKEERLLECNLIFKPMHRCRLTDDSYHEDVKWFGNSLWE